MILHRKDIEKITAALEQFSDVDIFELDVHHSSGMGSITTMTFNQEVNGVKGSFEIEISGVEDW